MASCEYDLFRVALSKSLHKINKAELEIKDKQYEALWSVVKNKSDTICVLPTGYGKSLIYQLLPFMFDFYPRGEDNDLSSSSSFVLVISPLNALMIDQISKLKDHVNVSIMKAVHVDESKDTMYSLGESLHTDSNPSKIIFAHA
jgi:superfamily II DNA helicase RecQ